MSNTNQDEAGAIQLGGLSETLVASTELLAFEPTSSQIAAADAFLGRFPTTTAALLALRAALVAVELDGDGNTASSDALLAAIPAIATVEARTL